MEGQGLIRCVPVLGHEFVVAEDQGLAASRTGWGADRRDSTATLTDWLGCFC